MGLAPRGTKSGDLTCVLEGGDVPVILRPDGKEFVLVGECYVHGIMDGAVMRNQEIALRNITLR